MEFYTAIKRKYTIPIQSNMDKSHKRNNEQKKPDTKEYITVQFHLYEVPKQETLINIW